MTLYWFHVKYVTIYILVLHVLNSDCYLKQLHIIFRHGERNPTETFPNDPYINYSWPGGWGQLTNGGKLQMYELGQLLKTEYNKFIGTYWYKDVNVTSSYSGRCLMSAESFCAGMFPPEGKQIWNQELLWQPVPISYLPRSQDTNIATKAPCTKYDRLFKEIRVSPTIMEIENNYKELKDYLTVHTGKTVNDIEDIEFIYNTLEIEQIQNLTLPNWLNNSMLAIMKKLGARNLALYTETEYMKRIKGGFFLRAMVDSMDKMLQGPETSKLFLYAAHDITLVHILRSLGLVDTIKPGFGAVLIFELYSDGEIKINYRNSWNVASEELIASKCPSSCYLNNFKTAFDSVLPVDFRTECEMDSS